MECSDLRGHDTAIEKGEKACDDRVEIIRGAEIPKRFWTDPLMYQGGSDAFLAPHDLNDGSGKPIDAGGAGYSCIAEQRTIEIIQDGAPTTSFLRFGDRVRIEMHDGDGESIFGTIDQTVVVYENG